MKIVIISGYFNPIHVGHIDYINAAKKLGDKLIVIVNNDKQVALKGSIQLMNEFDRLKIVQNINAVDEAWVSKDEDKSVCKSLEILNNIYKTEQIIFANGGDRKAENIPEYNLAKKLNIKLVFNVGGKKIRSSSKLLQKVKQ